MIDFLKKINKENNVTIIVTSHDMDDLEEMAERILMISGGKIAFDGSFSELRSLTGNLTRVVITMEADSAPRIKNGNLLAKTSIKDLLSQLSEVKGVRDVEIKKAPIEQVIAGLYKVWGSGARIG
jgi:ABC-2 type transport system ATP-binding protein